MLKMKLRTIVLAVSLSTASSSAFANLSDMQSMFNDIGVYGNASAPKAFAGQTRNYFTGGSAQIRIPKKTYQLATFDPPRIGAGCGGIDLYGGSFSFINSDQLVGMMKNIGNAAIGVAFDTALNSISPQLNASIKYFQDMANKINSMNVNSCEAATGLVLAGKKGIEAGSFDVAMTELGSNNLGFSGDWQGMKDMLNQDPTEYKRVKETAKADPSISDNEKMWLEPGNLVFKALGQLTESGGDTISKEEKEIIMGLVGTIIIKEGSGEKGENTSELHDRIETDLLKSFLGNTSETTTTIQTYRCQDSQCSTVLPIDWQTKPVAKMVSERLEKIREKIQNRSGGISASDYELIGMSSVPIWSVLVQEYRTDSGFNVLDRAGNLIAISYIKAVIDKTLQQVTLALGAYKDASNPAIERNIQIIRDNIKDVRNQLIVQLNKDQVEFRNFLAIQETLRLQSIRTREESAKRALKE